MLTEDQPPQGPAPAAPSEPPARPVERRRPLLRPNYGPKPAKPPQDACEA